MDSDYWVDNEGDVQRLRFQAEKFALGRTIKGVEVATDGIALHLDNGAAMKFQVSGMDMRIIFAWANAPRDPQVTVQ